MKNKSRKYTKNRILNKLTKKKNNSIKKRNTIKNINKIFKKTQKRYLKIGGNMELFSDKYPEYTLSGTGFKDKKTALYTLQILKNRDIDYQFQVVNTMYYRCLNVIKKTNDKNKIKKLKNALNIFKKWLDNYKKDNSKEMNLRKKFSKYLTLNVINNAELLAKYYNISRKARGLEKPTKSDKGFLVVYRNVKGDKKKLRTLPIKKDIPNGQTWDKHRNNYCIRRMSMLKNKDLYHKDGELKDLPTVLHTNMLMWGCTPDFDKINKMFLDKKIINKIKLLK